MPLRKKANKNGDGAGAEAVGAVMAPPNGDGQAPPPPLAPAEPPTMAAEPAPASPPPPQWEPPPPPAYQPRGGGGGLLTRAFGPPGEQSASERERIAEAEFRAAIAPAMELLQSAVPDAGSADEAARRLQDNLGDYTPDPNPGAYAPGDAFETDARVYYRLLRRDYERNPRPSESRKKTHHLHERYGLLPGTRGW